MTCTHASTKGVVSNARFAEGVALCVDLGTRVEGAVLAVGHLVVGEAGLEGHLEVEDRAGVGVTVETEGLITSEAADVVAEEEAVDVSMES